MSKFLLTSFAISAMITAPAMAQNVKGAQEYVAVPILSLDIGRDDLQNFTPGLAIGSRWDAGKQGAEWFAELGVSRNAYKEFSPSLEFGATTQLTKVGPGEIRGGVGVGITYFDELADQLDNESNYPSYKGYMPTFSLKTAYRYQDMEVRASIMPTFGDTTDAITTFSVTKGF